MIELAGTQSTTRAPYLAKRPALRAVFDALNAEALALHEENPELAVDRGMLGGEDDDSFAEALFEGGDLTHDDLLDLIGRCRRRIAEGLVEA